MSGIKRRASSFSWLYVLPVMALLLIAVWPLVNGSRTLFLRDLFNVHLSMKQQQAAALQDGHIPLVVPELAGGQPSLGNPNTVPLYPTNGLYLVAPLLWAFNAHFWLHLLLAPWAMCWLAREWGLPPPGAWAAGVVYGFSGYLFSHLNFYNLIAGVALAPALVAAILRLAAPSSERAGGRGRGRGRWAAAVAGLWLLLLLAGEPLIAALALLLGLAAVVARRGRELASPRQLVSTAGPLLAAGIAGTLLAAPQLVEFLRILPLSFRGYQGYSVTTRTIGSFHPMQALEALLPFCYGRPDLLRYGSFWAGPYYMEMPPLYFTLYPGVLALALLAASGRQRSALRLWAWLAIAGGLFLALGRYNPVANWLLGLPGLGLLRYPVKLFLPVSIGAALLAGLGFQRALVERQEAALSGLRRALTAGVALYLGLWAALNLTAGAATAWLRARVPANFPDDFVANERLRWSGLVFLTLLLLAVMLLLLRLSRRWPALAAALLALHVASQLFFLRPAMPTDEVTWYRQPSPLLVNLPPGSRVVHGADGKTFGPELYPGNPPQPRAFWLQRRVFYELYGAAGMLYGRAYELNLSPEGLGSFLTRAARDVTQQLDDVRRLRLLAAWGVDRLILNRELQPPARTQAELLASSQIQGVPVLIYRLPGATPEVFHAGTVYRAPHLNAAVDRLTAEDFDPRTAAVLPGDGPTQPGTPGTLQVRDQGPEHLEVEVEAATPGAVVWQRAHLPLYRATIDGTPAKVTVANLHRIAIETPAGHHQIRIWVDRRPLHVAAGVAVVGLLLLVVLCWRLGWRESEAPLAAGVETS